jgi:ethanolamine utilization protein EutQ
MELDKNSIEELVRKIIEEKLNGLLEAGIEKNVDPSGIQSIKLNTIKLGKAEQFDTGKEGDNVLLKDVLTVEESPRLGCGLMEMRETTFDWTLMYDEIDYVIEGRLEVNIDGRKISADAGEIILIPKGSKIQFCVPNYAKFMYVTYPANWAEQA